MNTIDQNIFQLLENPDWDNIHLASQLIEGQGFQDIHLEYFLKNMAMWYLHNFSPQKPYYNLLLLNQTTFEILLEKMNEFFEIPELKVHITQTGIQLNANLNTNSKPKDVQVFLKDMSAGLYHSVAIDFDLKFKG